MIKTILGKKIGMSQIFTDQGERIPVSAVEAGPCFVTQVKTAEGDGYNAVQLAFGDVLKKPSKPIQGHLKKSGVNPLRFLREVRVDNVVDVNDIKLGDEIKVDIFEEGELIDVVGVSKGKGFTGVIKRHNYSGGHASHGSRFHRGPGSIGCQTPTRVVKGTKLPGRHGGHAVSTQNLRIKKIVPEKNLLLIQGALPGPAGNLVVIKKAVKG